MKPLQDHTVRHHGDLDPGNRTKMSLDENSLAHLMSVLTDLYSDPMLAVIREYASNAYDAHKAAGNPEPIQVVLPSSFDPTYVVRDQGVGMSLDTVLNVFTKYGASTKRTTDDEVGMLGLGCKSALTYTSQFTLLSRKDGLQVTALVMRGESGVGEIEIVDTAATSQPDGVEIRVPVKEVIRFNEKAMEFFAWWEDGTVLVNGKAPEKPEGTLQVNDDLWAVPGTYANDIVVQGNVPYTLDNGHRLSKYGSTYSFVLRVDIGTVNFAPNREALNYTPRTEEVLREAEEYIQESFDLFIQRQIDAAPSLFDAIRLNNQFGGRHGTRYLYQGKPVPSTVQLPHGGWSYNLRDNKASKNNGAYVRPEQVKTIIYGHPTSTLTSKQRAQIQKYFANDDVYRVHIFYGPAPAWAHEDSLIPWENVAAMDVSLPKTQRSGGRSITVEWFAPSGRFTHDELEDVPDNKPYVLIGGSSFSVDDRADQWMVRSLNEQGLLPDTYTYISVRPRSQPKFRRENDTVGFKQVVEKVIKDYLSTISPDEADVLLTIPVRIDSGVNDILFKVMDRLDDPGLVEVLQSLKPEKEVVKKRESLAVLLKVAEGLDIPTPVKISRVEVLKNYQDLYPMVFERYYYGRKIATEDHFTLYINALYAYRQAQAL